MNIESKKMVKPISGIIVFLLVMVFFIFGAVPIQTKLGMYGVALTELIILVISIASAFVLKIDFKEAFKIKVPKIKELIGVILLWMGSYLTVILVTVVLQYFFVDFTELNTAMKNTFTSVSKPMALFIIAFLPALCEEVLHRGVILRTFHNIKNEKLIIIAMGILFGIFHLSFLRFLPTAILGMSLTYIMLKTHNFILPVLFHFINNFFTVWVSFSIGNSNASAQASNINVAVLGSYLFMAGLVPVLFKLASRLLSSEPKVTSRTNKIVTIAIVIVLMVSGIIVTNNGIKNKTVVCDNKIECSVNCDSLSIPIKFDVEEAGDYKISLGMFNERGISEFKIIDDMQNEVMKFQAKDITLTKDDLQLDVGKYTVLIDFHLDAKDKIFIGYDDDDKTMLGLNVNPEDFSNFKLNLNISKN